MTKGEGDREEAREGRRARGESQRPKIKDRVHIITTPAPQLHKQHRNQNHLIVLLNQPIKSKLYPRGKTLPQPSNRDPQQSSIAKQHTTKSHTHNQTHQPKRRKLPAHRSRRALRSNRLILPTSLSARCRSSAFLCLSCNHDRFGSQTPAGGLCCS